MAEAAEVAEVVPPVGQLTHAEPTFKTILFGSLRLALLVLIFVSASVSIVFTQIVGLPLARISPEWLDTWMALTKTSFAVLLTFNIQFFTPAVITISGDESMVDAMPASQLSSKPASSASGVSGGEKTVTSELRQRVQEATSVIADPVEKTSSISNVSSSATSLPAFFGRHTIIMSNHQLYTDWMYMWWIAYKQNLSHALTIMLKKSLRKLPLLGYGMENYKFIFMSRKWAEDEPVLARHMAELNDLRYPSWLLLFPEGTTLSTDGVEKSRIYAEKTGLHTYKHLLIPRATGLRFCLQNLPSYEYLYDSTIHYNGTPEGQYGEDYYSMKKIYLHGRYPNDVHIHWRRFRIKDIPLDDEAKFTEWLMRVWKEKDDLLSQFEIDGRFPCAPGVAYTQKMPVKLNRITEFFEIFTVPVSALLLLHTAYRLVTAFI